MTVKVNANHIIPLALLLLTVGFWAIFMLLVLRDAALSSDYSGTLVAVFPPGTEQQVLYNSVLQAQGRFVNSTWFNTAWVVHSDQPGFVARLEAQGLWKAFKPTLFQPFTVAGCFLAIPDLEIETVDKF